MDGKIADLVRKELDHKLNVNTRDIIYDVFVNNGAGITSVVIEVSNHFLFTSDAMKDIIATLHFYKLEMFVSGWKNTTSIHLK